MPGDVKATETIAPAAIHPHLVSGEEQRLQSPAPQPFHFLIVGHLYGTIEGNDRLPANTLLSKIEN